MTQHDCDRHHVADHVVCGQVITGLQQRADMLDQRLTEMVAIAQELADALSAPWYRPGRRLRILTAVDDLRAERKRIGR